MSRMFEERDLYQKYSQMSPRERYLEFGGLVFKSFPRFTLLDSIRGDQPFHEAFQEAFDEQNRATDKRIASRSGYREAIFNKLGVLLSFSPTTPSFKLVANRELEDAFDIGVNKRSGGIFIPEDQTKTPEPTIEFSRFEDVLFGIINTPWVFVRTIKHHLWHIQHYGDQSLDPFPKDRIALLTDAYDKDPENAGIFDKSKAKVIEKEMYEAALMEDVTRRSFFSISSGIRRTSLSLALRVEAKLGLLENELKRQSEPRLDISKFPYETYSRWLKEQRDYYKPH